MHHLKNKFVRCNQGVLTKLMPDQAAKDLLDQMADARALCDRWREENGEPMTVEQSKPNDPNKFPVICKMAEGGNKTECGRDAPNDGEWFTFNIDLATCPICRLAKRGVII